MQRLSLSEFNSLALSKAVLSKGDDNKVKTFSFRVATDTEYKSYPNQPTQLLTTQLALSESPDEAFVFEHPTVSKLNLPDFPGRCKPFKHGFIGVDILGLPEAPKTTKTETNLILDFLIFFSPTDVFRGLFNDEITSDRILENCSQNARLKVDIPSKGHSIDFITTGYKVFHPDWGCTELYLKISDYSGVNGKGSLAALTSALGVNRLDDKHVFSKPEIENMEVTYQTRTEDYLTYGIGDACVLFGISDAVENRFQNLAGVHALNVSKAPLTTGSTVNKIFQEYLKKYCGDFQAWTLFPNHKGKPGTFIDLVTEGGIKRLAGYSKTSLPSSALVNGGRAKNEKPTTFSASGVIADADISGAYSAQMSHLIYPIGVPTKYYTCTETNRKHTLGSFLKKYETDFVQGCWQIIVTGKLDFYQDLIPSKVVDPYLIELSESEDDEVNINAPFRIYTQEIINGVIIHDNLQIIKALSTQKEKSGFYNLEVVSAVYYPKSKQHFDREEWYKAVEVDKEETGNCLVAELDSRGSDSVTDVRSKHWLAVPLVDFIKPYQDARDVLKEKKKVCTKGSEEYFKYDALQTSFKLVINTLYGVIATDKLPSGNAVCANNITGGIRAFTWLLKVSLGSLQSITDGGAYDANRVNFRDYKPSFNTIAKLRNTDLLTKRSRLNIKTKPLGGSPWTLEKGCDSNWSILKSETVSWTVKGGLLPDLDQLALDHVKDFFRDCDIDLLSYQKIEHKYVFSGISTHSQTDYSFKDIWGQTTYKSRGKKTSGKRYEGGEDSNKVNFLDDLREGLAVTEYATQLIGEQVKVNKAKQFRTSKTESVFTRNGLTAGDVILKTSSTSIFSLSQFFYQTDCQYNTWEKGVEKLKDTTGQGLEQLFKNDDGSVNYQLLVETVQAKLDAGETWLKTGYWRV